MTLYRTDGSQILSGNELVEKQLLAQGWATIARNRYVYALLNGPMRAHEKHWREQTAIVAQKESCFFAALVRKELEIE